MEYFGITEDNMQRSLESYFIQAFCDVVGADNPGRISPRFTEAIAGEVIDEVNSVLSVAMQASLDGGCSSITAAASCWVSKDKAKKKDFGRSYHNHEILPHRTRHCSEEEASDRQSLRLCQ